MRARVVFPESLAGVIVPVVVSTLVLVVGAFVTRRYAGPAQQAYQVALTGRLDVLMAERDEARSDLERMKAELEILRAKVADLERQVRDLTQENLELRRRLPERSSRA